MLINRITIHSKRFDLRISSYIHYTKPTFKVISYHSLPLSNPELQEINTTKDTLIYNNLISINREPMSHDRKEHTYS